MTPADVSRPVKKRDAHAVDRPRGSAPRARGGVPALHALRQVEQGIPKDEAARLFERIAAGTALPVGKLRAELIPDSSWKRSGERLRRTASQTTARLRRVLSLAMKVWEDDSEAIAWLTGPHPMLGGATPFSLLRTEAGGRAVEDLLAAIEYGFSA